MSNGRCRMHGGKSTGRPVTHGHYTKESLQTRKSLIELNRAVNEILKSIR
jgi:hypothetical protein